MSGCFGVPIVEIPDMCLSKNGGYPKTDYHAESDDQHWDLDVRICKRPSHILK